MAASLPSSCLLAEHLIRRIREDIAFLSTHSLLDQHDTNSINATLDRASANITSRSRDVDALNAKMGGMGVGGQPAQPPVYFQNQQPQQQQDTRERAKALWAYTASQPDDLAFSKEQILIIHSKDNEHWYRGSIESDGPNGRVGLFPSNHVEVIPRSASSSFTPPPPPAHYSQPQQPQPYQPYTDEKQHTSSSYYGGAPAPPQHYPSSSSYNSQYQQQQPQQIVVAGPPEPAKKPSKFGGGGLKNTLAHSAVGGLGFGAGSAVASEIVHSIF